MKSIVYQKQKIKRNEILEIFRRKTDDGADEKPQGEVRLFEKNSENNWRRRIYDALNVLQNSGAVDGEKVIQIPKDKKDMTGLIVLREELYKYYYLKKTDYIQKEKLLAQKCFEAGLLQGLLAGRKASQSQPLPPGSENQGLTDTQQSAEPRTIRLPFYVIPAEGSQKVTCR